MPTISIPESYTKPYVGSDGSLPRKELNIIKEDYTAYFSPPESFHPEDVCHAYAADAYPEEYALDEGLDAHAAQRLAGKRGSDEEERERDEMLGKLVHATAEQTAGSRRSVAD